MISPESEAGEQWRCRWVLLCLVTDLCRGSGVLAGSKGSAISSSYNLCVVLLRATKRKKLLTHVKIQLRIKLLLNGSDEILLSSCWCPASWQAPGGATEQVNEIGLNT